MVFISKDKLDSLVRLAEREGNDRSKRNLREATARNKVLQENLENAKAELDALKKTRADMRKIKKLELELEIQSDELEANQALLDSKQKRLDSRLKDLEKEDADQYKKGYADGVADGLRKVTELTEQDRNNMTKIAMVSAARGTDAAQIKGVTDVLQLSESNANPKAK